MPKFSKSEFAFAPLSISQTTLFASLAPTCLVQKPLKLPPVTKQEFRSAKRWVVDLLRQIVREFAHSTA